ncbi:type VI secretion system protein [Chromobacterium sp. IIBBL 290-4]|uniref:type VI secretion system protein n=1 Tax=Chromobacterium sp. IIBBL 290-4 TaxID=2953890 RepID=UPI0020B745AA|nr:type VI secretion system protein [Chromobacterium sp. IIBBL 290-4]UTH75141.1 type VI secretion system protein [Chromobacterium sp. IIBBL 290-4]
MAWLVFWIALFLLLAAAGLWWLRREADPARRSFRGAVRRFEREIGADDRYQTPWVLVLGEQVRGAESLAAALQLKSDGEANWFGRWWYGNDGAVLVPPDDMFKHPEGALAPLSAWRRLLGVLLRARGQRPLDALIWVVSADKLWSESLSVSAGLAASRKFSDLQQRLGLSLPIYMVVSGAEQVPGFLDLTRALPREARDATLGWSSPYVPGMAYQPEWIGLAMESLQQTAAEAVAEIGALQGSISPELYLLPRRLAAARANLQSLCDPVFRGNALGEAPSLRGIYFIGAQAGGGEGIAPEPPFFAGRLLRRRILAEQGLAQPVPRILRLRKRWQRWALAGTGLMAVLWVAGMTWFWSMATERVEILRQQRQSYAQENGGVAARQAGDAQAVQRMALLWRALGQIPQRRFSSLLFPTSLFSSLDERVDQSWREAFADIILKPTQLRLLRDASKVARLGEGDVQDVDEDASPDSWPEYAQARQLADAASNLERQVGRYNRAVQDPAVAPDEAVPLLNSLFELNFAPLPAGAKTHLAEALASSDQSLGPLVRLNQIRPLTAAHFQNAMQTWYDRLYTGKTFSRTADIVEERLKDLTNRRIGSAQQLQQLVDEIDMLQRLTNSINNAWSRASGRELVPGYGAMMDKAARGSLIGSDVVAATEDAGRRARQAFHRQWLSQSSPSSLLEQQSSGSLTLRKSVSQLQVALEAFLSRPSGDDGKPSSLTGMNAARLTAVMRDHGDYQKLLLSADLPFEYREGAVVAMNAVMAGRMRYELGRRADMAKPGDAAGGAADFDAMAHQMPSLLAAFEDLGRSDLRDEVVGEMDRRALASLRGASLLLQSSEAYRPQRGGFDWWDGGRNAGVKAFRAANEGELKQYLAGQIDWLGGVVQSQSSSLSWLAPRKDGLSVGDQALIERWQKTDAELRRYREKAVDSAPALLETLISRELNEMDVGNCRRVLDQAALPVAGNLFADRAQALVKMAGSRCDALRGQVGAAAYQRLAAYFNQYLANRFPFSANAGAEDAAPERVAEFLKLLDDNAELAGGGLRDLKSDRVLAARRFLEQARYAQSWLAPLFARDNSGAWQGVDLDLRWRTDRERERAADQVIEWTWSAGGSRTSYPAASTSRVHWAVGQPVTLTLRWAKDSAQAPADDAAQRGLSVFDRIASWSYDGQWAMLRLMRDNQAPSNIAGRNGDWALMLNLPVRNADGAGLSHARMFLRLAPTTKGGIAAGTLPYFAPPSPYRSDERAAANINVTDSRGTSDGRRD